MDNSSGTVWYANSIYSNKKLTFEIDFCQKKPYSFKLTIVESRMQETDVQETETLLFAKKSRQTRNSFRAQILTLTYFPKTSK